MVYDKLRKIEVSVNEFDFECPHCDCNLLQKNKLKVTPIDISYKPNNIETKVMKNKYLAYRYEKLPTLRQAIFKAANFSNNSRLLLECQECANAIHYQNINIKKLRVWLNKHIPEKMVIYRDENGRSNIRF